jgi:hypothetical protein
MNPKTQQKILKVIAQLFTELDYWLDKLGLSKPQIVQIYASVLNENGMMAQFVADLTANVLPVSAKFAITPERIIDELRRAESGEFAAWLLLQQEPPSEELNELLKGMKDVLANLRQHFSQAAKGGPRRRRGRRRNLDDPALREQIRAEINKLRKPGVKLADIYARLALKYSKAFKRKIGPATIKRVRYEKIP